jgi:hypothetical protein
MDALQLELPVGSAHDAAHAVGLEAPQLQAAAKQGPAQYGSLPEVGDRMKRSERIFLSYLQEFAARGGPWGVLKSGALNPQGGASRVKGQPSPHGIRMHAPDGPRSCRVRFHPGEQARRLEAEAALNDTAMHVASGGVIFGVLGDGKSLWRSGLLKERGRTLQVDVDISGVDVLELRTSINGLHIGAHAVGLEPRVQT